VAQGGRPTAAQAAKLAGLLDEAETEAAIVRLVGAILHEQNDEWMVQRSRYLSLETIATLSDNLAVSLLDMAA
jgi:hypothetical protein